MQLPRNILQAALVSNEAAFQQFAYNSQTEVTMELFLLTGSNNPGWARIFQFGKYNVNNSLSFALDRYDDNETVDDISNSNIKSTTNNNSNKRDIVHDRIDNDIINYDKCNTLTVNSLTATSGSTGDNISNTTTNKRHLQSSNNNNNNNPRYDNFMLEYFNIENGFNAYPFFQAYTNVPFNNQFTPLYIAIIISYRLKTTIYINGVKYTSEIKLDAPVNNEDDNIIYNNNYNFFGRSLDPGTYM